jgi:uncharacterized membrane protein YphA (DoxX/SURF4 family)
MSVASIETGRVRNRRVGVWILQIVVALAFLAAGAAKLAAAPFMVQLFAQIGSAGGSALSLASSKWSALALSCVRAWLRSEVSGSASRCSLPC